MTLFLATSCFYDNEEYLYPDDGFCDPPARITYQNFVSELMQTHCNSCHNPGNPSGNVITSTYQGLVTVAENGRLFGAINHEPGFTPMPLGLNQLPSCDLAQINSWIESGAPQE